MGGFDTGGFLTGLLGGFNKGMTDKAVRDTEAKLREHQENRKLIDSILDNPNIDPNTKRTMIQKITVMNLPPEGKGKGKGGKGGNPIVEAIRGLATRYKAGVEGSELPKLRQQTGQENEALQEFGKLPLYGGQPEAGAQEATQSATGSPQGAERASLPPLPSRGAGTAGGDGGGARVYDPGMSSPEARRGAVSQNNLPPMPANPRVQAQAEGRPGMFRRPEEIATEAARAKQAGAQADINWVMSAATPEERQMRGQMAGITVPLPVPQATEQLTQLVQGLPKEQQSALTALFNMYTGFGNPTEGLKEVAKAAEKYRDDERKFGQQKAIEIAKEEYGVKKMGAMFAQQFALVDKRALGSIKTLAEARKIVADQSADPDMKAAAQTFIDRQTKLAASPKLTPTQQNKILNTYLEARKLLADMRANQVKGDKGDAQADFALLSDHISMTLRASGMRPTANLLLDARKNRNLFDDFVVRFIDHPTTGVTLSSTQRRQMVGLAQQRLPLIKKQVQDEFQAAGAEIPSVLQDTQGGQIPKTADEYLKGINAPTN